MNAKEKRQRHGRIALLNDDAGEEVARTVNRIVNPSARFAGEVTLAEWSPKELSAFEKKLHGIVRSEVSRYARTIATRVRAARRAA